MSQKKKILYIITKGTWGGAQKYVYDLITNLPKDEFQTYFACGGEIGLLYEKLIKIGITPIIIPNLKRDIGVHDILAVREIKKLIKKINPDIVHLNSSKAGYMGTYINNNKTVFTVHGWPFIEDRNFILKKIFEIISKKTGDNSTKVITISNRDFDDAIAIGIDKDKLTKILNGIDINKDLYKKEESKRKMSLSFDNNIRIIASIGELTKNKGFKYALEAISILINKGIKNFHYVIIGHGEDKEKLEKIIYEKKLENFVTLYGFLSNAEKYLMGFDIFLLPSVKEGLPYVLLEAGVAGLPVIATDVGGVREIIDNNKTGLIIEPKNSEEIAYALEKILKNISGDNNKSITKEYGNLFRQKIKEKFTLNKMVNETVNVYKSIL